MSSYRVLLARPGSLRIAVASGVGWLAFAGYGLGLVLAIQHATGSFATAGGATAAFAAGSALLAPVRGGLVDRYGAPGLLALAAFHNAALLGVVAACTLTAPPTWLLIAATAATGATAPPLAATSRVAWVRVAGPKLTRTAHAVNAALGEAAAVVSPIATSLIAAATSPVIALGLLVPGIGMAAIGLGASLPSITDPPSELPRDSADAQRFSLLRQSRGLRWLMLGDVVSGTWLAGLEVAAAAIAVEKGQVALAGVPLLGLAVGGTAATLWAGSASGSAAPERRFVWGAIGAAIVLPWAVIFPGVLPLAGLSVLAGAALGLTNVALFELVDHVADEARAVEAFTWITSAQATGLAIGGAAAGTLAEMTPSHALWVVAATPALGAAGAIYAQRSGLLSET